MNVKVFRPKEPECVLGSWWQVVEADLLEQKEENKRALQRIRELESSIAELNGQLAMERLANQEAKEENIALQSGLKSAKKELTNKNERLLCLRELQKDLHKSLGAVSMEYSECEIKNQGLEQERTDLLNETSEQKQSLEKYARDTKNLHSCVAKQFQTVESLTNNILELKSKIKILESARKHDNKRTEILLGRNKTLQQKLEESRKVHGPPSEWSKKKIQEQQLEIKKLSKLVIRLKLSGENFSPKKAKTGSKAKRRPTSAPRIPLKLTKRKSSKRRLARSPDSMMSSNAKENINHMLRRKLKIASGRAF